MIREKLLLREPGEEMMKKLFVITIWILLFLSADSKPAQESKWFWQEDRTILNPAGIDLRNTSDIFFWDWDADGNIDVFLRRYKRYGVVGPPEYYHNESNPTAPFRLVSEFNSGLSVPEMSPIGGLIMVNLSANGFPLLVTNRAQGNSISLVAWHNLGSLSYPNWLADTLLFAGISWPIADGVQNPTFADLDNDGDLDLIIGHGNRFKGTNLRYFENLSTSTQTLWREDSSVVGGIARQVSRYYDRWWSPQFINANGDSWPDVLLAVCWTDIKSIMMITSQSQQQQVQWQVFNKPIAALPYPLGEFNDLILSDLDHDGQEDIVVNSINYLYPDLGLRIYPNISATDEANYSSQYIQFGSIPAMAGASVFDYKKNGLPDLILGESYPFRFNSYIYNALTRSEYAGLFCWKNSEWLGKLRPVDGSGLTNTLVDLFGSDKLYFVSWGHGSDVFNTEIFSFRNVGSDTFFQWSEETEIFRAFMASDYPADLFVKPAFGDLDGDGDQDLLIQKYDLNDKGFEFYENRFEQDVYIWQLRPEWELGLQDYLDIMTCAALVDLDCDGDLDLAAIADYDSLIGFLNIGNSAKPCWRFQSEIFAGIKIQGRYPPAFGDFNQDHRPDLIMRDADGWLSCYLNLSDVGVAEGAERGRAGLDFLIEQNYPNPFNATTIIPFQLSQTAKVRLEIYNLSGQKVRTLAAGEKSPGSYRIPWNGRDDADNCLASGVYGLRLQAGSRQQCRKIVLIR